MKQLKKQFIKKHFLRQKKKTDEETAEELYQYCLSFVALRPRSEKEIKIKINRYSTKHKIPDRIISYIFDILKKNKIIDDRDFVDWWVQQRSDFRPQGRRLLQMQLRQKGIANEIINNYFDQNSLQEEDLARRALSKKIASFSSYDNKTKQKKAMQYLVRRGFSWETVKKVFEETVLMV